MVNGMMLSSSKHLYFVQTLKICVALCADSKYVSFYLSGLS